VSALLGLVLALATMAGRLGGGSLTASGSAAPRPALVSQVIRVVAPGDTLWTIARDAQPVGDIRPLVQQLDASRHGKPLQVGERISVTVQN
jgi:LysM repeat protein